jgi:ABC-2 type transport system ATP-binding protein
VDEPVIRVDGLTKRYGNVVAVDGLSFEVPPGSVFGFLGPNGAGKTTTINLLLGLIEPSGGTASVLGFNTGTAADQIRARVGAMLDEHGLYEHLSAYENLDFYGRVGRMPADQRESRITRALEDIDLWDRRHDRAGDWSKGMQQRQALARALLHDPQLLFLDEPTAGLDVVSAREVRAQLVDLASQGRTIFLTTHNMAEAEELCARVAVISEGRLLAEGAPTSLVPGSGYDVTVRGENLEAAASAVGRRPDVVSCTVADGELILRMTSADPSPVVSQLVNAGASIHEVTRGSHLEDAFLKLVSPES